MGAAQSTSHPHVLKTSLGDLTGFEQRDKSDKPILYRYTRIPYALPPVGELRWRRPQPLPDTFTFNNIESGQPGDYTSFSPTCPQPLYNLGAAHVDNPNADPEIESVQDEDCLYLNIWVPAGTPPEGGWPIQFYIHGGWLQIGDPLQTHEYDPFDLFAHSTPRILVSPTYRLNLFGFLGGAELASATPDPFVGNYGLWDQRAAIQWTHDHISLFGGNPSKITVGGLSAGAHSTCLQLYYDSYLPPEKQIIKQIYLYSNAIAIQPDSTTSPKLTDQFNSLCSAVNILSSLLAEEKLSQLRKAPAETLVAAIPKLDVHTFRSSTDGPIESGGFIPPTFLASLHDGSYTTRLAKRGIRIMVGEVRDEAELYKLINPPSSRDDLLRQLGNYYPTPVADALVALPMYAVPSASDTNDTPPEEWAGIFARIVADMQVHASTRGFVHSLLSPPKNSEVKALPSSKLSRYHVAWRAKSLDDWLKPEVGLCHAADAPIWWMSGWRAGYTEKDKEIVKEFLGPFEAFIACEENSDGLGKQGKETKEDEVRVLGPDGSIEIKKDERWDAGLQVWEAAWKAQRTQG